MAPGGFKDNGPQQPKKVKEPPCGTAKPGEKCYEEITWAKSDGIYANPEWYPGPLGCMCSLKKLKIGLESI